MQKLFLPAINKASATKTVKLVSLCLGLLWLFDSLICGNGQAAINCPSMPDVGQINRDWRVDVQGSVGSLGKVKAGEVATKTEVIAKNLFEKYPNIDRLVTVQMMSATYCSILRDSAGLSERDRQERWEKFQERVFSFVRPDSSRSTSPVKKPGKTNEKTPDKPSQPLPREESKTESKPSQPQTQPLPLAQPRPSQATPPPAKDPRMANFEADAHMKADIRGVIQNKDKITFLISHPKDEQEYLVFVSNLLSSACRETPRQCWFTQEGNPRELDKPRLQRTSKPGIVVHGSDANALANALGNWFQAYSISRLPPEMDGYKVEPTSELIWIDIGPGEPWK